jgi:hypothetical protein
MAPGTRMASGEAPYEGSPGEAPEAGGPKRARDSNGPTTKETKVDDRKRSGEVWFAEVRWGLLVFR